MLENRKIVTNQQLLLLLEELDRKPGLSHEKALDGSTNFFDAKWQKLVNKLNAVPNGAKKSMLRWKAVFSDWKLSVKLQASSNENIDNPEELDAMGKKVLALIKREEMLDEIELIVLQDFPEIPVASALRPVQLMNEQGMGGLRTIYDSNVDGASSPQTKIAKMQMERLNSVAQQLENQILAIQNRIQMIKDYYHYEENSSDEE